MARVSTKYRSIDLTMTLLRQAQRLCALLADDDYESEAATYESMIESLSANAIKLTVSDGPELPRRLSESEREIFKHRPVTTIHSDIESEDDNDEIYNYHRSAVAQIYLTSSENLARFQHTDENDDDEMTEKLDQIELDVTEL